MSLPLGIALGAILRVRAWIPSTAAATALSFVVPYLAYIPTEELHGSGLVAAVVAAIVTGQGSARHFTAEQRLSDRVNWRRMSRPSSCSCAPHPAVGAHPPQAGGIPHRVGRHV